MLLIQDGSIFHKQISICEYGGFIENFPQIAHTNTLFMRNTNELYLLYIYKYTCIVTIICIWARVSCELLFSLRS